MALLGAALGENIGDKPRFAGELPAKPGRRGMLKALFSSKKAVAGAVLLGVFVVMGATLVVVDRGLSRLQPERA